MALGAGSRDAAATLGGSRGRGCRQERSPARVTLGQMFPEELGLRYLSNLRTKQVFMYLLLSK